MVQPGSFARPADKGECGYIQEVTKPKAIAVAALNVSMPQGTIVRLGRALDTARAVLVECQENLLIRTTSRNARALAAAIQDESAEVSRLENLDIRVQYPTDGDWRITRLIFVLLRPRDTPMPE